MGKLQCNWSQLRTINNIRYSYFYTVFCQQNQQRQTIRKSSVTEMTFYGSRTLPYELSIRVDANDICGENRIYTS